MSIEIKRLVNPDYPEVPDWILYESGGYSNPIRILSNYEMGKIVGEYNKCNNKVIKENEN